VIRDLVQSPGLINELEQAASWAISAGVELLYPFLDRDVISLALRIRPEDLYGGGRMKTPLRDLVLRHLQASNIPKKKVDFSLPGEQLMHAGARQTWQRLGGADRLEKLNVVDNTGVKRFIEEYLTGTEARRFWKAWGILSAEDWVRSRA
jgi:asparagine synthetase B (glutamine-hydrolysing)